MQISIPNIHLSYSICTAVWSPRHLNTLFRIHTINLLLYKKQPQYKPHYYLKLIAQKNLESQQKNCFYLTRCEPGTCGSKCCLYPEEIIYLLSAWKKKIWLLVAIVYHTLMFIIKYYTNVFVWLDITPPNLPWLKTWPISFLFNLQKKDWTYIPQSLLNDQSNHTAGRKFKRHL